jgi:hypothetical protein
MSTQVIRFSSSLLLAFLALHSAEEGLGKDHNETQMAEKI